MSQSLAAEPAIPGLLWAIRFDDDGKGHPIPHGEPIGEPDAFGSGFLWLHFNLIDARLDPVVASGRLGPPRLAASALGSDEHQRIAVEGAYVGGVVTDLCPEARSTVALTGQVRLHFILGPRFLVSGRRRPISAPAAVREALQAGASINTPIHLLEALMEHVVGSIDEGGARLSDELDLIEDHILDRTTRDERRRLGPIRRDAVRLHRQLLGLRAVFHRLEGDGTEAGLPASDIRTAARLAQRLDALDRDMIILAERSRLLQEELSSRLAEASNRQLYMLSILTALFLPPTLVTGIFGMNTTGLPFSAFQDGTALALTACASSALLAYGVIRLMGIRPPRD
ncbi:transporter [Enterovirga rhinocerotis]|nr:transporter [Enterovirga rhinocerotis]